MILKEFCSILRFSGTSRDVNLTHLCTNFGLVDMKLALWVFPLHYTSEVTTKISAIFLIWNAPTWGPYYLKAASKWNSEINKKWDSGHISAPGPWIKQGLRRTRKLRQCTNWKVSLLICKLTKASNKENWSAQLVCPAGRSSWSV